MADQKFSEFTEATILGGTEKLVGLKDGDNAQFPVSFWPIITKISLSSANILALFTTPITLIAAPGAGKFIRPLSMTMVLNYGGATYSGNSMNAEVGSLTPLSSAIYTSSADAVEMKMSGTTSTTGLIDIVNVPLMLTVSGQNPTTGNGTMDIYISYTVVNL